MEHTGLSRRLFISTAAVGAAEVISPLLLRSSGEVRAETRRKLLPLVIFFQGGAQSPYEFVSPLTDSPRELKGDGDVIRAKNGMLIDSRWPAFADISDKTAVIRSLNAGNVAHDANPVVGQPGKLGDKFADGGIPHPLIELPSNFSDLSRLDRTIGMHIRWNDAEQRFAPPPIDADPRLDEKMELLRKLESHSVEVSGPKIERMERNRTLAASLLGGTANALKTPFERAQAQKERYGNHPIGDACALASELAQSGAGVTVVYNEFQRGWDLHTNMREGYDAIIPPTDRALAELILDARRHGFVLLMTSEHGRTPVINSSGGRDHFTTSYAVLAGGSVREGEIIGSVDKRGGIAHEEVKGDKLMATALAACGEKTDNRSLLVDRAVR